MAEVMRYAEMKDSGVDWLGEIPSHWNVARLKYLFSIKKDIAGKDGYTVLSVTQRGIVPKNMMDKGQFAMDYSKYQIVTSGEFIMNHMDLLTGWVDISSYDGVTSPDYRVFFMKKGAGYAPYYRYIFQTCYTCRIFYGLGQGVAGFGRWRLPAELFLNFELPIPSIEEQQAIASYLDDQCTQIDDIIASAKVSIEEYKAWKASVIYEAVTKGLDASAEMKDSGVGWIGMMPSHWGTIALKLATSKIGSGKTPSGGAEVYSSEGIMFLRSQNVYNTGLILDDVSFISEEIDEEMKNTRVQYRDVLLNITGGSIGRCCLFDKKERANVNQHVCIIRTIQEKILPEYLRYFWNSACGPVVVEKFQTGGNRAGLNFEQIGSVKIPWPAVDEQQKIVAHLDSLCREIDQLISEKEGLIVDLESYKKSLIYEVVTGKRKVA